MSFSFKNKIVFITGASRGIGLELAKVFSRRKAFVIGSSTSKKSTQFITNMIQKRGNGFGIKIDFNSKEDINVAFQYLKKYKKLPDILVNNAGITRDRLMIKLSKQDWDNVIDVNLNAVFKISQIFLLNMLKKKWGRIINIGSIVGISGNPGQTNYCSSKAGLIGLSKSLAQEIATRNITVNVIAPGFIKTDMIEKINYQQRKKIIDTIPSKSIGTSKDVANMAIYLASDYARYITGQTHHINGGMFMV
jgi:3-oxoacyl-[acyl-carrier protein] reductase